MKETYTTAVQPAATNREQENHPERPVPASELSREGNMNTETIIVAGASYLVVEREAGPCAHPSPLVNARLTIRRPKGKKLYRVWEYKVGRINQHGAVEKYSQKWEV